MRKVETVEEYLGELPLVQKEEFERIKTVVMSCIPEAKLGISYGMPAFKYKDKPLLYFGAFTNHMSIFPTATPIEELKDKLSKWEISKGTLKYSPQKLIPAEIIVELIAIRRAQIDAKK